MAQQLNLNDPRFTPQRLHLGARQTLWAMAGLAVLSFAVSQGMVWQASRRSADAAAVQAALTPLRGALLAQGTTTAGGTASAASTANAANSATTANTQPSPGAEITRLQQLDSAQRRILAALDQGVGSSLQAAEGHAGYLQALARQASTQLWLTGFSVSADGRDIDLEGRMSDAKALPDYLRRLNAEPRFKGRPFAQLSLKAVDAEAGSGALAHTAFSLRSSASGQTNASSAANATVKP